MFEIEIKNLKTKAKFTVTPGSEQVRYTIERDGFIETFNEHIKQMCDNIPNQINYNR
mgnify:CR=1 FL=1